MIEEIRRKIERAEYEYSLHAADQSLRRGIVRKEVEEAFKSGIVIDSREAATHSMHSSGPASH